MPRSFHEPIDHDDIFERAEAEERRARMASVLARNEEIAKQDAEAAAIRKLAADELSARANASARLREFERHGVKPPIIDGVETKSSLSLLMQLGWTIENLLGQNKLIAPPPAEPRPRKRREDYDQNS